MTVELKQYSPRAEEEKHIPGRDVMNESYDNPAFALNGDKSSESVVVVEPDGKVTILTLQFVHM